MATSFVAAIPDPDALYEYVIERCTNPDSIFHGPNHWRHVAKVGHLLCEHVEADPVVVFLFALFHDCNRLNDDDDPNHGQRGRVLAQSVEQTRLFTVTLLQRNTLILACDYHTEGKDGSFLSKDPTIAVCWDADRLNLMRVNKIPEREYLSTDYAKDANVIIWASSEVGQEAPSWAELHRRYAEL